MVEKLKNRKAKNFCPESLEHEAQVLGSREPDPEPVTEQIILSLPFSDVLICMYHRGHTVSRSSCAFSFSCYSKPPGPWAKCPRSLQKVYGKGSMHGQHHLPLRLCLSFSCASGMWALLVAQALSERAGIALRLPKC